MNALDCLVQPHNLQQGGRVNLYISSSCEKEWRAVFRSFLLLFANSRNTFLPFILADLVHLRVAYRSFEVKYLIFRVIFTNSSHLTIWIQKHENFLGPRRSTSPSPPTLLSIQLIHLRLSKSFPTRITSSLCWAHRTGGFVWFLLDWLADFNSASSCLSAHQFTTWITGMYTNPSFFCNVGVFNY